MKIRYWVNHKTRMCSMTTGPLRKNEMSDDGFVEVPSEVEMEEFRAITKKAKDAGWGCSPRTFQKFLDKGNSQ